MNVKVVLLPTNHDPDSFVKEKGLSGFESFVQANKKDFILFKLALLLEEAQNDPIKKAALVGDILDSISKIPDAIKRSIYLKESANLLGVSEQILLNESNKKRKAFSNQNKNEPSPTETELSENNVIKEALVEQDVDYIDAGINIENFEREVIRTLIEYGSKPYTEELLTIDYILQSLAETPLDNSLHNKILHLVKEIDKPEEKMNLSDFFVNHSDEEISNLAITLLLGNYNKYDNDLSPRWTEKKIYTPSKNDIYKEDIDTEIYYLQFWRIKLLEIEVLKRMKSLAEGEDFTKLLMMKKKIDEEKAKMAKIKNTRITPQ